MRRYRILGAEFCQRELTFGQYEECRAILGKYKHAFQGNAQTFGMYLDEMVDAGVVQQLLPKFLKLYQPNLYWRARNAVALWRRGVKRDAMYKEMQGSEVAQVMTDFFLTNIAWMSNLLVLPSSSNSTQQGRTTSRSSSRSWYTFWRATTHSKPKASAN